MKLKPLEYSLTFKNTNEAQNMFITDNKEEFDKAFVSAKDIFS